jgi:hypothetical protein
MAEPSQISKESKKLAWEDAKAEVLRRFLTFLPDDVGGGCYIMPGTTSAVRRVLDCLRPHLRTGLTTLLTTDDEYPGIIAALDEFWPGPMFIAKTSDFIWTSAQGKTEQFLEQCAHIVRPQVVYVSHVTRAAGFRFTEGFFQRMRKAMPTAVIIVDGAQSFGNVDLRCDVGFFQSVDAYITSGHKFGGGKTYSGLIWVGPCLDHVIQDPAVGYTRTQGSGSTGDLPALQSLCDSLGRNFTYLGQTFAEALAYRLPKSPGIVVTEHDNQCGVVAVRHVSDDQLKRLNIAGKRGEHFTVLSPERWRNPQEGIVTGREAHSISVKNAWGSQSAWRFSVDRYSVHDECASSAVAGQGHCVRFSCPPQVSQGDCTIIVDQLQSIILP